MPRDTLGTLPGRPSEVAPLPSHLRRPPRARRSSSAAPVPRPLAVEAAAVERLVDEREALLDLWPWSVVEVDDA